MTFMEIMAAPRLLGRELECVHVGPRERQNRVLRNDVLFNGSSETAEEIALSAVVDFDPSTTTFLNSFCFGYRVHRSDLIDPAFLAYMFRSGVGRTLVAPLAQGAIRYNISKTKLLDLMLLLPTVEEQRAIVAALRDCEDAIAAASHRLMKARAIKGGMLAGAADRPDAPSTGRARRMSNVGQIERKTQERVVKLLNEVLGYDYLGNWEYREGNSNVEVELLIANLQARGYDDNLISRAIDRIKSEASLGGARDLYEANQDVYRLLRYGVKVKPGVGEQTETVWLIDWKQPAEERLRGRGGSDDRRCSQQASRPGALRQRHCARDNRAEAIESRCLGGHPTDHRQSEGSTSSDRSSRLSSS